MGITAEKIQRQTVRRYRTLGGDVVVIPGKTIIVTAPLNGTLHPPNKMRIPKPGETLVAGQPIFSFVPLLPPERDVPSAAERVQMANAEASLLTARTVAAGVVEQAKAEIHGAEVRLKLAKQLYEDMTGTKRAVVEADATLNLAQKKHEAALATKKALDELSLDSKKRNVTTLQITSPDLGLLRNLSATSGQRVTAGSTLFEVIDTNTVWIRVPIYVGQLEDFDLTKVARIGALTGRPRKSQRTAKRTAAPPTADAASNTVHVYYEMANRDGKLRPGQRVGVTLPLNSKANSLVLPWGAVVYDIHGTTWVYEKTAENVFRRRRVFVRYSHYDDEKKKELAVLESGPAVGTEVVVDGVAELFGTEFGVGK